MEFRSFSPTFIKKRINEIWSSIPKPQQISFKYYYENFDHKNIEESFVTDIQAILFLMPFLYKKTKKRVGFSQQVASSQRNNFVYYFQVVKFRRQLAITSNRQDYLKLKFPKNDHSSITPNDMLVATLLLLPPVFNIRLINKTNSSSWGLDDDDEFRCAFIMAFMIYGYEYDFDSSNPSFFYFNNAKQVKCLNKENLYTFLKYNHLPTKLNLNRYSYNQILKFDPKLICRFESNAVQRRKLAYKAIQTTMLCSPRALPTELWQIITAFVINSVNRVLV
jgi:hypothetical protein